MKRLTAAVLFLIASLLLSAESSRAADPRIELKKGNHIAVIGNTTADRMQHHAWLETYIHSVYPDLDLTFRNLGFPGDEVKTRSRSANFGSPDQWLTKVQADVVFCFFGYNEALRGESAVDGFRNDLGAMIDGMRAQKYNGQAAPQLVVFSPIAHENRRSPHLPDGTENNGKLRIYTQAMQDVCRSKEVTFVDLFTPTLSMYASAKTPLTMNGIHLLDHGNRHVAEFIMYDLFAAPGMDHTDKAIVRLREAVLEKNYHWFSRYRVVDGYNVFGGRSKLAWFGQSNADVMMREMEIFDVKTANRDKLVWAVARGEDYTVKDDNLPDELEVKTNKPGQLAGQKHPYLSGTDAITKMTIHEGMKVNLFASEERFPRLINPVQIAVDTDSRLWASVWPSYPHWNPAQPRRDALVILPDDDNDGVADRCVVFADELNSVTGFEFWGGGVLVAAPPEIWFLKDTDGDDKADFKIRMLQGVSSADTHHSANAVVMGPDGWLCWSRGIFNVANFETPTQTFRSGASGVHTFNPRTFETEFRFPIGPNPHGDVIDQWGYQFASDGTSGTGSYVNIGKGVGNKKWYVKRVRPVPATGILSSSHFPEEHEGNFLICNAIGFLGVLQHEVKYNGADITAEEVEPIVFSSDPNFRPSDVEVGGDGALYISDWHNVLIGHMQHNMRDPNRDHEHGRIYRVTYKGRDLVKPAKMKGKPIAEVCQNFFANEDSTRYRARLELTGRKADAIRKDVTAFASKLDVADADDAQALLECLWVFEEQRIPNAELLRTVFKAAGPRVRAAAIRTLGHWGEKVDDWEPTLIAASRDESALVRAEAVKAAVSFEGVTAAEVVFETATRPTDPELLTVLNYAKGKINADALVQDALKSGKTLSKAAQAYALLNASVSDLMKMEPSEAVYSAILSRPSVPPQTLATSLTGLALMRKVSPVDLLIGLITERDKGGQTDGLDGLGRLLASFPAGELKPARNQIEDLATQAKSADTRQLGYASLVSADGTGANAFFAASKSKETLRDMLAAVPMIQSADVRTELYPDVRALIFELPPGLDPEPVSGGLSQAGIQVDFFKQNPRNADAATFAKMKPTASGIVPEIVMNVPQKTTSDGFGLQFTGNVLVPKSGKYTFFTSSDDGSRLYIGKKLVVNNDGLHGMVEKNGTIELAAGPHPILVTYFDNGGGDGLNVTWSGPGMKKQKIAADRLAVSGGQNLHDVAIRSLASIPGNEAEKFRDLSTLVKTGRSRTAAIEVLRTLPDTAWDNKGISSLVDNLVGYLSTIPAEYRTGGPAMEAVALTRSLSKRLSAEEATAVELRLQNLDVRIIAIGTVPARMIYDKEQIAVQAGKPVEFRFSNSDHMPHNFAIVLPGSLAEVGELAEATGRDLDAQARHYIPKSDKILLASKALEPGQRQALTFEASTEPGVYPYVCTYPGHWRRMYGALYVVADLDAYTANPSEYLAANPLPLKDELLKFIGRNTDWKFDDLIASVSPLPHGRSFEVGQNLFKVASCVACHKIGEQGRHLGPDLTKIEPKKHTTEHILRSLLEPSKEIAEKYQSNTFVLDSGKIITGMVVKETPDQVSVLVDPLAKAAPVVIKTADVDTRVKSPLSIMPKGVLSKLTQEEILDLVAFIFAKGDKKHMLFMKHDH